MLHRASSHCLDPLVLLLTPPSSMQVLFADALQGTKEYKRAVVRCLMHAALLCLYADRPHTNRLPRKSPYAMRTTCLGMDAPGKHMRCQAVHATPPAKQFPARSTSHRAGYMTWFCKTL